MGWQDDARRTIVSEKIELREFPGYWVKVKLYSVKGKDEITLSTRAVQKAIDKKALISLMKKAQAAHGEALTEEQMLERLTQDELSALVESNSVELYSMTYAKIKNGIDSHNFCDGEKSTEVENFAKDILEYDKIAQEILGHIEEFNRPLPSKTSKPSEMSPNGFTTEASLSTEIASQTDDNPPN
jgi:hypothetical protein